MRVLVLNLDRSRDRMAAMAEHLYEREVQFERLSAIDGQLIEGVDLDAWRARHPHYGPGPRTTDEGIKGWLGCTRSHRMAALHIAETWEGPTLVLEDDARLTVDWEERAAEVLEARDVELLILGHMIPPRTRRPSIVECVHPRLCHAYVIVEQQTALDLAECWLNEEVEADESWWPITSRGRCFATSPPTARQTYGRSDITGKMAGAPRA